MLLQQTAQRNPIYFQSVLTSDQQTAVVGQLMRLIAEFVISPFLSLKSMQDLFFGGLLNLTLVRIIV
jgi:hypothetical protein